MQKAGVSRWALIPDYGSARQMTTGLLEFSAEKCNHCLTCSKICPARSILIDRDPVSRAWQLPRIETVAPEVSLCVACGCCLAACPQEAISIRRGFRAGGYYRRLVQAPEMTYPRRY